MSPGSVLALGALAVVVVLWLCISFLQPSARRAGLEWIATTAMFLGLAAWFVELSLEVHADGRTLLLVPFGFLAFLFSAGLCVSTWRTLAHLLGRSAAANTATN